MNIKKIFIIIFRLLGICIAMIVSFITAAAITNPEATVNTQSVGMVADLAEVMIFSLCIWQKHCSTSRN